MNIRLKLTARILPFSMVLFMMAGASPLNAQVLNNEKEIDLVTTDRFQHTKTVKAGLLNVGYAETGPENGKPVILLHGWPYDIHSFEKSSAILAGKGYRVLVPYLRGYGTTTFLSARTIRNAQQSAVALDIIKFMDALKIDKAIIGGFDWGARTADIIAALWPERCSARSRERIPHWQP